MTWNRTAHLLGLVGGLLLASGCAKTPQPPPTRADNAGTSTPAVAQESTRVVVDSVETQTELPPFAGEAMPAVPQIDLYQLDPAQQTILTDSVRGRFQGEPFTPTVSLSGDELTFRQLPTKPGEGERAIIFRIPANTSSLVVAPDAQASDATPRIDTLSFHNEKPSLQSYLNGYGLTLQLGPVQQGKRRGKIALALPDDAKSFLNGTFVAEVMRLPDERPTADDQPFLEGPIEVVGETKGELEVGRIGAPQGTVSVESVFLNLEGPTPRLARTESNQPTAALVTTAGELRYELTRLRPGRYLVWVKTTSGLAAWTWQTIDETTKSNLPLKLDVAAHGKATIKLPANLTGAVTLLPKDETEAADPNEILPDTALAFALKLEASPTDGVANFDRVPAGRYRVVVLRPGEATPAIADEIEVKPSETTTKELAVP